MDRRVNILIYLNKNWENDYGGDLQLWDKNMEKCEKIFPLFNTMVIFSTNDFSNHGHPEPPIVLKTSQENQLHCIISQKVDPKVILITKISKINILQNRQGFKEVDISNFEKFKNVLRKFDLYQKVKNFEKNISEKINNNLMNSNDLEIYCNY